jgi:hypothetical protein
LRHWAWGNVTEMGGTPCRSDVNTPKDVGLSIVWFRRATLLGPHLLKAAIIADGIISPYPHHPLSGAEARVARLRGMAVAQGGPPPALAFSGSFNAERDKWCRESLNDNEPSRVPKSVTIFSRRWRG